MKEFRSRRLRVWENINRTMQEFKFLLLGYRSYTALLTQTGTDAPVATVLENTLEQNLIYTYNSPGVYFITGNFPIDKTIVFLTMNYYTPLGYLTGNATINKIDETTIIIKTFAIDTTPTDTLLYNTSIEIRVYN